MFPVTWERGVFFRMFIIEYDWNANMILRIDRVLTRIR